MRFPLRQYVVRKDMIIVHKCQLNETYRLDTGARDQTHGYPEGRKGCTHWKFITQDERLYDILDATDMPCLSSYDFFLDFHVTASHCFPRVVFVRLCAGNDVRDTNLSIAPRFLRAIRARSWTMSSELDSRHHSAQRNFICV
jgi:hypothetical protein